MRSPRHSSAKVGQVIEDDLDSTGTELLYDTSDRASSNIRAESSEKIHHSRCRPSIKYRDAILCILQQNLYGVDLNEEAIQIGRLSLWIKTAKHGRKLNKDSFLPFHTGTFVSVKRK